MEKKIDSSGHTKGRKAVLVLGSIGFVIVCAFTGPPWLAPKDADNMPNPLANDQEAAKIGSSIFKKNCEMCHGSKGKGDGPAGLSLQTRPANLPSEAVQKNTDGALFWKIGNGRSPMPAFKSMLTDQQRWQVVRYIRVLGAKKS